jgi:hypothetical protein
MFAFCRAAGLCRQLGELAHLVGDDGLAGFGLFGYYCRRL